MSISKSVPPAIATFMLTSETPAEDIVHHHKKTLTNTIQMVDALQHGTYDAIRTA
jgi:phosphoribosylanthranilate isomerase